MLDFGWPELLIIVAVAVIVIGPAEIPALMVGLGRVFKRFQYMKFAISSQFDDIMRDAGISDIRDQVNFEAKDKDKDLDFDEASADSTEHMEMEPIAAHKKAIAIDEAAEGEAAEGEAAEAGEEV